MSFDPEEVCRIAHLALIAITPDEVADYSHHFSRILSFVDQLKSYNTDDVIPMVHPHAMIQRLRADEVTEINRREEFQKAAPAVTDGLYLVPQVIE